MLVIIELKIASTAAKLGLIKAEITHNKCSKLYGRSRFERWVNSGKLAPSKTTGRNRYYKQVDIDVLLADESRYFMKPEKTKK